MFSHNFFLLVGHSCHLNMLHIQKDAVEKLYFGDFGKNHYYFEDLSIFYSFKVSCLKISLSLRNLLN